MPTNRLWLEHTERAAWDSVQALREKLAAAEERLQRFTPIKETWQSIVEALDRARSDLNIQKERYSEIAHALVNELRDARLAREQLTADLEAARDASAAPAISQPVRRSADSVLDAVDSDTRPSDETIAAVRAILDQYDADAGVFTGRRKLTLTRKALERRLEELDELEESSPSELTEAAVRIGALALRLFSLSRMELPRKASQDDDDE